jgi:hypothetical protein
MGLERITSNQSLTRTCTKPNQIASWLVHSWSTFGAKTSHGQTHIHKTHHSPDLGKPHLPLYSILCAWPRDQHPNVLLLGLLQLWGLVILREDLQLKWSLKQSCNPRWEISNCMLHATCTRGNQGDLWLLVVGSQFANLTFGPSFGHNLCFRCPNGSCEPILDIYVPRDFQWYKEILNLLGFDPKNCSLKIQESTKTPTPKVEAPLGVWGFIPSHFPSLPSCLLGS